MRKPILFFLSSLALVASFSSQAAKPDGYQLLEEIPKESETLEGQTFEKPTITIKEEGENKIEEYSINGDVYMIKVTPPNGKSYYLHREERDGAWVDDGPSPLPSIPKWIIFKF